MNIIMFLDFGILFLNITKIVPFVEKNYKNKMYHRKSYLHLISKWYLKTAV